MISITPDPLLSFRLLGKQSGYTLLVDENGKLRHLGWSPCPNPEALTAPPQDAPLPSLHACEAAAREIYAFGETTAAQPSLLVAWDADCGIEVGAEEAANFPLRDLQLSYAHHRIHPAAEPAGAPRHGQPAQKPKPEALEIVLKDERLDFEVSLFYRIYRDCDVIERWCEIRNATPGTARVEHLDFATWNLPSGDYTVSTPTGQQFGEFQLQRTPLAAGLTLTTRNGNLFTGHRANPAVLLEADESTCGDAYAVCLAYSGNWQINVESIYAGPVRVHGGEDAYDTHFALASSERHRTPASFATCSADGAAGVAHNLHQLQRDYLQPRPAGKDPLRPVLYNSWEATEFNLSYPQQKALAEKAAAMGVELYVVDDGWFGARRNDSAGLGDWTVSREVFPDGLRPLIDDVHALGMQFGIWFEPEMVNPDSDLYRAHPDWVLHYPGRARALQRRQLILDFGRPEVVAHIEKCLTTFLDAHPVDFIKSDMNRNAHPAGSLAGRAIWRRHTEAVYGLMDRLRARYPQLSLQSCASGGGRVNSGMAQRVEQFWISDNTDAFDRIQIQDTYSQFYAPNAMECWVTESPNLLTKRPSDLSLRFAVAMRGVLGIGSDLSHLSEEERTRYSSYIAFYKQVRPLVQGGIRHIVACASDHGVSAWWFVNQTGTEGFLSIARVDSLPGRHAPRLKLPGLAPAATFALSTPEGTPLPEYSGQELGTFGIYSDQNPFALTGIKPGHGQVIHFKSIIETKTKLS